MIDYRRANFEAMKRAITLHKKLRTDMTRQVDVYAAIKGIGVDLAFLPLANLSGAYLRATEETGGLAGIVVNSKHPRSRQRFSAGHELGHHLRDGNQEVLIVDRQTEFHTRTAGLMKNQREATAEAFAAWFLMPRRLVEHLAGELHIADQPTAEDVYTLSLGLGTSYLATAGHLRALKVVTKDAYDRLAKVPPKWIKAQMAAHGPGDSWGDVWLIRQGDHDSARVTPRPGDEIVVELFEIPTSGYVWRLHGEPRHVRLVESDYEEASRAGAEDTYGANGRRRIVLQADHPGEETVQLEMARPWEASKPPQRVFTLEIAVETRLETQLVGAT